MLLSIPIILASLSLSLIDLYSEEEIQRNLSQSIFSAFIAFIIAIVSIHAMIKLLQVTNLSPANVKKKNERAIEMHKAQPFGGYCSRSPPPVFPAPRNPASPVPELP